MKKTKTQEKRVLEMLQNAGDQGVSNLEFNAAGIQRYGGYIYSLRQDGHNIRTQHIYSRVFLYSVSSSPVPFTRTIALVNEAKSRKAGIKGNKLYDRALALLISGAWVTTSEFTEQGILRLGVVIQYLREYYGLDIDCERISDDPDEDTGWQYRLNL